MSENQPESSVRQSDHDVLRELADAGNETALDGLADLAHARGDVQELNELLDEGCGRAGAHLADRAVAERNLIELQRLADEGVEQAEDALQQLLR